MRILQTWAFAMDEGVAVAGRGGVVIREGTRGLERRRHVHGGAGERRAQRHRVQFPGFKARVDTPSKAMHTIHLLLSSTGGRLDEPSIACTGHRDRHLGCGRLISGNRVIFPGSHRTWDDSKAMLLVGPRGGLQNHPHFAANPKGGSVWRLFRSSSTCFRAPMPNGSPSLAIAPVGPARMGDLQQPQP